MPSARLLASRRSSRPEDVYERAKRTLDKCVLNGTTHVRTHLEVDRVIGLRSLEGILPLVREFKWAMDIEICIFPQEGLLNNPGTDELMVEGLRHGGSVVGAAPYTDSDPTGQIDRVFEIRPRVRYRHRYASGFRTRRPRRWTWTMCAI